MDGQLLNLSNRSLYRVFTRTWEQNGRFYGAFWQNLSQDVRKNGLRIQGERVSELDYRTCHLRILCELVGHSMPFQDPGFDPFLITGYPRRQIKTAFVILLNTRSRNGAKQALATAIAERRGDVRAGTEDFRLAEELLKVVAEAFPFLSRFWCEGFGPRLLNIDAEICAENLRILMERGVTCLPVHDSFIVAERHRDFLSRVMEDAFKAVMSKLSKRWEYIPTTLATVH